MFKIRILQIIIFATVLSGCGKYILAPKGTVPTRKEIVEDAYGAWIKIYPIEGPTLIEGEFIALKKDQILYLYSNQLKSFSIAKVKNCDIIVYNSNSSNFLQFPEYDWIYLSRFARFPQGIPEGLDITKLRSRSQD